MERNEPPQPTRRQFLKGFTTGTVAIGALTQSGCGPAIPPLKTAAQPRRRPSAPSAASAAARLFRRATEKVINIEGDPGHPISEGTCAARERRPSRWSTTRAACRRFSTARRGRRWLGGERAGTGRWNGSPPESKKRAIKRSRPRWTGRVVNRTEGIAGLGGSALDNEEAISWSNWRGRWAWSTSSTRPDSDTAPRSPVWRPHSAGER